MLPRRSRRTRLGTPRAPASRATTRTRGCPPCRGGCPSPRSETNSSSNQASRSTRFRHSGSARPDPDPSTGLSLSRAPNLAGRGTRSLTVLDDPARCGTAPPPGNYPETPAATREPRSSTHRNHAVATGRKAGKVPGSSALQRPRPLVSAVLHTDEVTGSNPVPPTLPNAYLRSGFRLPRGVPGAASERPVS